MATTPKKEPALRVVAKREGFRRIGRRFGGDAQVIPLSELKKGEAEALRAEPMLVVTDTTVDVADEGAPK